MTDELLKRLREDTDAALKDLAAWREMMERQSIIERDIMLHGQDADTIAKDVITLRERVDALWTQVDRIGVPKGAATLIDAVAELQQDARTQRESAENATTDHAALHDRVNTLERQHNARWSVEQDTRTRLLALERIARALVKAHSDHANALHVLLNACNIELKTFPPGGEGQDLSLEGEVGTSPGPKGKTS